MYWQTTRFQIALDRPLVMGIVNVTPDSFSDGALHDNTTAALRHCEKLLRDGADILDIGGESTRPGATPLSLQDELQRVLPVVRQAVKFGRPVSVDTYKAPVMQAVLQLGADIINDVWALRWPDAQGQVAAPQVIAAHPNCGVCLMHMHLEPQTMQVQPMQGDVPDQVRQFLQQSVQALCHLGVARNRISIDPGIGFGKTVAQNFSLLARQSELLALGQPVLVGWSRKSSLALMSAGAKLEARERLAPSLAAAICALQKGAAIVRVHDVKETVQAIKVLAAINNSGNDADHQTGGSLP